MAGSSPDLSLLDDLNDHCFVLATQYVTDLCRELAEEAGRKPTLDELCGLLAWGLRSMPEDAVGNINPVNVQSLTAKVSKRKKIEARPGDVIAIPSKKTGYYFVVLITTNTFGWAFGILKGRHLTAHLSPATSPDALPHHVYSGGRLVANGRWRVIAHRPDLLARFPAEPEQYHRKADHPHNERIGPFGSGETASGKLRNLTQQEAEELGLLTRGYMQGMLEETLESYLEKTLD